MQASKFVGKKTMLASNSQTEDSNSPSLSATISSKGSSAKTPSQTGKAPSKSTSSSAATAGGVQDTRYKIQEALFYVGYI